MSENSNHIIEKILEEFKTLAANGDMLDEANVVKPPDALLNGTQHYELSILINREIQTTQIRRG